MVTSELSSRSTVMVPSRLRPADRPAVTSDRQATFGVSVADPHQGFLIAPSGPHRARLQDAAAAISAVPGPIAIIVRPVAVAIRVGRCGRDAEADRGSAHAPAPARATPAPAAPARTPAGATPAEPGPAPAESGAAQANGTTAPAADGGAAETAKTTAAKTADNPCVGRLRNQHQQADRGASHHRKCPGAHRTLPFVLHAQKHVAPARRILDVDQISATCADAAFSRLKNARRRTSCLSG